MKTLKPELLEPFLQEQPVVVDVRPKDQYNPADFEAAENIPLEDIQNSKHQLPTNRSILLLCERGVVSELAGLYLEAAGYTQVYNLEGGFKKLRLFRSSTTQ